MKDYVNSAALQEYTTKLVAKLKTLFPGTPTAAATVADMTDHNKTYVYVGTESGYTAGDWYYWNGSAWTSGGPFQATSIITDTTLAVAGEAADAKATGDAIAAAKTAVLNAMAPAYSTSDTYAVGRYVNHDGKIYRCTTAITTAEAWTAGHWTEVPLGTDLADQVGALKESLDDLEDVIYPNQNAIVTSVAPVEQAGANWYYDISLLSVGVTYRIVLSISDATHLSNIRTSKAESGSGNVDTVTADFVGESWETGKTLLYTPAVEGIKFLQVQFNSAYTTNEADISITVYNYTKEQTPVTEDLKSQDSLLESEITAISPAIYLDDDYNLLPPYGYTVGKLIQPTGVIINDAGSVLSDYVPIDPAQGYICNWAKTASVVYGNSDLTGNTNTFIRYCFCFFDGEKNVLPFTGNTMAVSKAIPENARYIRVTLISEELYHLARLIYGNYNSQPIVRICDYHKRNKDIYAEANTGFEHFKMVMFGDSITHGSLSISDDGTSYVDYANDYLHSDIINVGFGGTRMTYTLEEAGLFCFYNLCDCIVSEDADAWDDLDAYALINTTYAPHLATLKAIDWTTVNAIGLMYGANDYASNTPVGSSYNETLTNYDGACAYGLKKLLAKYPHLQVMILSPFDREMTAGDASTMTDVAQNSAGLLMSDYGDSLENVVSRFHCPLIRTDKLFGINQYTILTYAPDGTHPRANIAQKRLGWLFAQAVRNNLAPFNG